MEPTEFIDKLLAQVSLDAVEFASDVERLLAEQVVYLRGQVDARQREAVVGAHRVISELYARLDDKNAQIESLQSEVQFLRSQLT